MRMLQSAAEQPAGLHELMAGFVDGRCIVMHRSNKRVFAGNAAHEREVFADCECRHGRAYRPKRTTHFLWRIGFQIPSIELAGTADKEQEDAALLAT
jgi:hypothetical protein